MDKNKTYLVLNHGTSRVGFSTRTESYIIEGGSNHEPSSMPFTIDELHQINSNSQVFKSGLLRFEKEFEKDLYEELRIKNWKDILTNEEIEEIIMNPTMESLKRIVDIQTEIYFERIYGVYMGLKNEGYPISQNVQIIMKKRRKEFAKNKRKSQIILTPKDANINNLGKDEVDNLKIQNAELLEKIEKLQKMVEKQLAFGSSKPVVNKQENETVVVKSTKNPVGRPKKSKK